MNKIYNRYNYTNTKIYNNSVKFNYINIVDNILYAQYISEEPTSHYSLIEYKNDLYSFDLTDMKNLIIKHEIRSDHCLISKIGILCIEPYYDETIRKYKLIRKYNDGRTINYCTVWFPMIRNINCNNNKLYLFGNKYITIIHENNQLQNININYGESHIKSIKTRFNSCDSLYIQANNKIHLISDTNNLRIDKSITIDNNYIRGLSIDYYDNILFNYNTDKLVTIFDPSLNDHINISTKYNHKSNVVYYDKALYYINRSNYLIKETYDFI